MAKSWQVFGFKQGEWSVLTEEHRGKVFDWFKDNGFPIRVVHPNGSWFITANQDKARELGLDVKFANRPEKPKASKPKAPKPKASKSKAPKPKAPKPKASKPKATKPKASSTVDAEGFLVGSWNAA